MASEHVYITAGHLAYGKGESPAHLKPHQERLSRAAKHCAERNRGLRGSGRWREAQSNCVKAAMDALKAGKPLPK